MIAEDFPTPEIAAVDKFQPADRPLAQIARRIAGIDYIEG
jgi:hypothetical protein